MTEAEIILLMVKSIPVILAVAIFLHLLCDEYLRALESRGLIRRRPAGGEAAGGTAAEGETTGEEKSG